MTDRQLYVSDLGTMGYADALELQRRFARQRISGELDQDLLLLVEHPHVITLGRSAQAAHLVASPQVLAARGVGTFEVERGGDVTYHGPGQLVGYAIVDLKRHRQDLHWYLRQLEAALIEALRTFGVAGARSPGQTGVWVSGEASPTETPRKVASIGVHARDWVTWHGFALNVTTDLSYFGLMVPCGIPGVEMTSVAREVEHNRTGQPVTMALARRAVAAAFGRVFELEPAEYPALLNPPSAVG